MPVLEQSWSFRAAALRDWRGMVGWLRRLLAETAWPPASDEWLKGPVR
jgi:hypothetical protein